MAVIDWKPIAELPNELKDGRDLLLWHSGMLAFVGSWQTNGWHGGVITRLLEPTHFAEINAPDA